MRILIFRLKRGFNHVFTNNGFRSKANSIIFAKTSTFFGISQLGFKVEYNPVSLSYHYHFCGLLRFPSGTRRSHARISWTVFTYLFYILAYSRRIHRCTSVHKHLQRYYNEINGEEMDGINKMVINIYPCQLDVHK